MNHHDAACLIQKHWRKYMSRKRLENISKLIDSSRIKVSRLEFEQRQVALVHPSRLGEFYLQKRIRACIKIQNWYRKCKRVPDIVVKSELPVISKEKSIDYNVAFELLKARPAPKLGLDMNVLDKLLDGYYQHKNEKPIRSENVLDQIRSILTNWDHEQNVIFTRKPDMLDHFNYLEWAEKDWWERFQDNDEYFKELK